MKALKFTALAAVVFAGMFAGPAAWANNSVLKIATLANYPPYSGKDLPHRGVSTHILTTAFERAGYQPKVTVMPWARALEMVKRGRYDVLPNAWYRESRTAFLHYTDEIAETRLVFAKPEGSSFSFSSIDDLKGKTIGVVQGYGYPDSFQSAENFKRSVTNSLRNTLAMTAAGRVDLAVGDALVVQHTLNTKLPNVKDEVALTSGAIQVDPIYVTVSRKRDDHAEIVKRFNAALAEMRADGTYADIMAEHNLK